MPTSPTFLFPRTAGFQLLNARTAEICRVPATTSMSDLLALAASTFPGATTLAYLDMDDDWVTLASDHDLLFAQASAAEGTELLLRATTAPRPAAEPATGAAPAAGAAAFAWGCVLHGRFFPGPHFSLPPHAPAPLHAHAHPTPCPRLRRRARRVFARAVQRASTARAGRGG